MTQSTILQGCTMAIFKSSHFQIFVSSGLLQNNSNVIKESFLFSEFQTWTDNFAKAIAFLCISKSSFSNIWCFLVTNNSNVIKQSFFGCFWILSFDPNSPFCQGYKFNYIFKIVSFSIFGVFSSAVFAEQL